MAHYLDSTWELRDRLPLTIMIARAASGLTLALGLVPIVADLYACAILVMVAGCGRVAGRDRHEGRCWGWNMEGLQRGILLLGH